MDHAGAQQLDPALALTGGAAHAAALVALHVHLAGGLGEGEVVGAEAGLGALAVELLHHGVEGALQIRHGDALVDDHALHLMEHGGVGGVHLVLAVHPAGGDDADGQRQVIEKTLDFLPEKEKKETIKKTCQRTFQALRIDVNHEFEVLYEFMEKLPDALRPGGRVAILTFHSGEDKLVKKALKAGYKEGIYSDYAKDVIRPSAKECTQNPRARSTKMRWAIKAE